MVLITAYRQAMEIPFALLPQQAPIARTVLVVHDGTDYAERTSLLAMAGDATAVALLDAPGDRMDAYSCDEVYAAELPWLVGWLRDTNPHAKFVGVGASLGALALLHAHARQPLFDAMLLQSGSFFRGAEESYEHGFRQFARIAGFVERLHAGDSGRPVPTTITCGMNEQNLACNQALAEALSVSRRLTAEWHPGGHDWRSWDGALNDQLGPLVHELARPSLTPAPQAPLLMPSASSGVELGA